jgi:exosortase A
MVLDQEKLRRGDWGPAAGLFILSLLVVLGVYRSTAISLGTLWTESSDFSHGWLILPIFVWLIWNNRAGWIDSKPQASMLGLCVAILAGLIWFLGDLARVSVVRQLGLVTFIPALCLLIFGFDFIRNNLFAFCFVFFAVPAGEALNPILMRYTADATVWALHKSGIPVYREGLHFILPTGSWSVVDACSGLRYLISSLILGLLFAYLNYRSLKKKIVFMVSCLVLAIVANWVRAYSVVMVGHLTHMKYGTGDDHVWYGWVFFGVMMMAIFWIGVKFGDFKESTKLTSQASTVDALKVDAPRTTSYLSAKSALTVGLGVIAIIVWSSLPSRLRDFQPIPNFAPEVFKLSAVAPSSAFPFKPDFPGALSEVTGTGTRGSSLQVSYFARQDINPELFQSGNRLVSDSHPTARIISESVRQTEGLTATGSLREYSVLINNERWLVWHWFVVGEHGAANAYLAKALRSVSMSLGRGDHSALLVVAQRDNRVANELQDAMLADAKVLHMATIKEISTGRK